MIKAYLLYAGEDGHSHVTAGSIAEGALVKTDHALFKETAPHSSFDWHNAPVSQYVITLSGILEFSTKTGEHFTLNPGDVLLATDTTGSGHQWRLINEDSWKRIYVVFQHNVETFFIPDQLI
jgi:hypothetical protein